MILNPSFRSLCSLQPTKGKHDFLFVCLYVVIVFICWYNCNRIYYTLDVWVIYFRYRLKMPFYENTRIPYHV
ncbi:hypothetical protein L6452_24271 [Arctium lappa]|uniref:Uncharacterized protein n=1 Tax=Arctium lappa TaxID=4217 RepID=A0ACB9A934_ARCLA|nr:hypothetical protein L6452_24271 [Arctium lappa]